MKFSKSLLKTEDIASKIFKNGVMKSKELLTEVFGLDFRNNDERIVSISDNEDLFKYEVVFSLNDRHITVKFSFDEDSNSDIVSEVLEINEIEKEDIISIDIDKSNISNFNSNIDKIIDYLEKRFELNFTPLDPEDKDEKIKQIVKKEENLNTIWYVKFIQEYHEGSFELYYNHIDKSIELTKNKKHKIYLD